VSADESPAPPHVAYERRVREFAIQLQSQRGRLAALRPDATNAAAHVEEALDERAMLLRAFEELQVEQEELRTAEEELREQVDELARVSATAAADRERYRELFENALDGLVITDRFGVIRELNSAACALLGLDSRVLRGKQLTAFLVDDAAGFRRVLDAVGCGEMQEIELTLRRSTGARTAVLLRGALSTVGGRLLWTLRELATQEPRSISGFYAKVPPSDDPQRVARDAQELLSRERRVREQLERASAAKDRFLAILSHDLRAPLNAVLGWTQLLQREVLDHNARKRALSTIERNARVQLALIEDILDISRLTEDKLQLVLQPTDVRAVVARTVEALVPAAQDAEIELAAALEPGDYVTFADPKRLGQVVTNLLSNAIKFTLPRGRVSVTLAQRDSRAELVVRDTGRGIDPAMLPHVFERFKQEDSGGAGGGLGLGLFIVRQLVELHGGTVIAESAGKGHGSAFTVTLPLRPVEAPAASEVRLPTSVADLHGMRVVVVDDDDDTRDLVCLLLERHGAVVAGAKDTPSALALVDAFGPDVVVSDIGLPGEDGYTLVRRIREKHLGIAFVALSGFAERRHVQQAFRAGFAMFLSKPVDTAALLDAVANVSAARA